jgi:hypothetical protein
VADEVDEVLAAVRQKIEEGRLGAAVMARLAPIRMRIARRSRFCSPDYFPAPATG